MWMDKGRALSTTKCSQMFQILLKVDIQNNIYTFSEKQSQQFESSSVCVSKILIALYLAHEHSSTRAQTAIVLDWRHYRSLSYKTQRSSLCLLVQIQDKNSFLGQFLNPIYPAKNTFMC